MFFSAVILIDRAYAQDAPYKTLKGKVERKEYHTYIEHPFILPDGVKRLRVEFSYTGKVFALLVAARNNESDPAECQCRKGAVPRRAAITFTLILKMIAAPEPIRPEVFRLIRVTLFSPFFQK